LPLDFHPGNRENQEKKETYMSKNLTRKGLALGAVVALGTTLFAGAPAQAASVLFAPTTGTGNTLVAGETFSLTASLSSDLPASNSSQLKFKVVNTTGVATSQIKVDGNLAGHVNYATTGSTDAGDVWATAPAAGSAKVFAVAASPNPTKIEIVSTAATTASYAVTAFLDANNNGTVDTGELSAAQTVNFVKIADSGLTTAFTKPSIGSTALKAVLTFGADVNVAQLTAGRYAVAYGLYGVSGKDAVASSSTTFGLTAASGNVGDVVDDYNSTDYAGKLISNVSAVAVPAVGATYSAQPVFGGALVASEVFQAVASSADADVTALVVAPTISNDVVATTASSTSVSGSYKVRAGVAATAVKATIKKTATGATTATAVGAGVVVNVAVSGLTLGTASGATAADTITVNGVAVTAATLSTYATTVTTDASGVVTVPVVTSAGTATDQITVTLTVANAAATATGAVSLVWTTAAVVAPVDLIAGANTPVHTSVVGGNYSVSYALRDQFNALYTGTAYQLVYTTPGVQGSSSTAPTSKTVYVPFVNGVATVSYAENSTGAGTNAATYTLQKATNGLWANDSLATSVAASYAVAAVAPVAAAVTATATVSTDAVRDVAETFVSVDKRVNFNGVTIPSAFTASSLNTISGAVTQASGVAVAGATVTIAAPGVQFIAGDVYAVGSITVTANASGEYTVSAYSHTSGKVTFTVTSGAATKTVDVAYAAAVQANAKTTTVVIPSTSQTGRAVSLSAKVVDVYGNAVTGVVVKFAATVGTLSDKSATTDETGIASVKLISQLGEDGDSVVTISHSGANGSTDTTDDFTVAKTVTFGLTDAIIDNVGKRVSATASYSNGKTVSFYVDGFKKWSKRSSSDADVVLYYNLKKGTHTVTVKISGGFVTTEKILVK
jgi:hypothetical protein